MGSPLGSMAEKQSIDLKDLRGDVIAIDGNIDLYQYITAITDDWNDYIRNDRGEPISHLIGLISRLAPVMRAGVKPVYVFDGGYPDLKDETVSSRRSPEAKENFETAKANGDQKSARRYAYQKAGISDFMVESSIELLDAMGIPAFRAPAEGEPQAAQLVHDGIANHVVSEDWDTVLYDIPTLVRDFSSSGASLVYTDQILGDQNWSIEQLRWYCVLLGSDYNRSVKGIGSIRGQNIVDNAASFEDVMDEAESWGDLDRDRWRRSLELFEDPEVTKDPSISWGPLVMENVSDIARVKYGLAEWQVESRLKDVQADAHL